MKKIVAITACPTGIAHTYMAAEMLESTAKKLNVLIKVETHGAIGVENELQDTDIEQADAVIIASDISIDESRFIGMKVYKTTTAKAISNTKEVILETLKKDD